MDQNINAVKLNVLTLKNEKTSECYDILNKKTHLIARTGFNGDLEISDGSVSRSHAEISLVKNTIGSKVKLVLEVIDKKSKFGTFVNTGIELDERIESNCPIILELGDRIRFGIMDSIWTVVKYSIVACPSTLKMADKDVLKKSLVEIGAQVIREWSEQCTHLCMNSVTVTEKVLLCLASAKSIISVKYFVDLCKALSPGSSMEIPFCVDYKPNLIEKILNPNLVSLNVNNKRKALFFGKIFICSTMEQLNRLSKIVDAAGGKIINYFDGYITDDDILNCKEHIVMQQDPHNTANSDKYRLILEKLEIKNKRPIPESNIGLSIIYSSTEIYCNPNYNVSLVNLQSQPSATVSQSSVILAPETEVLTVDDSEIYVNTVANSHSKTQSQLKRPLEIIMESEEIIMPNKRALLFDDKEKNNSRIKTVETNFEPTPTSSNNIFKLSKHGNEKKNNSVEVNVEENFESFKRVIKPTQSSSNNHTFQFSEYDNKEKNNSIKENVEKPTTSKSNHIFKSSNFNNDEKNNSVKTRMEKHLEPFKKVNEPTPSSSNNTFKFSEYKKTVSVVNDIISSDANSCLDTVQNVHTISNKNVNNVNNSHSNLVDEAVVTKRKFQNVCSTLDNEDSDLFDYMDIDEIEEHPKKKSKKELVESVFLPILSETSSNNSKPSKSVEPAAKNVVDPNFIMNLLSTAKGTGQFIDASKLSDKSSLNVFGDIEHDDLLNSVIIETVKMVVSKPIKIQNTGQGSNSSLQNFKKFKRKGPVMRIPHIVPLKLSQID